MAKSKVHILDKSALRDCTGCAGCSLVCPSNAISINMNENGFFRPSIEMNLCTMCGVCIDVCYKFNEFDNNNPYKNSDVIAVTNNYIDDMNMVTTAGVANRLAEYFYEKDYRICAVKYDYSSDTTKHDIADSLNDILEYRGSKYIPSDNRIAFEIILREKKKSIVFGLPCQIHGLRKVIEKKKIEDKFILIDFFCAGILSKNLWDKYLDYLRRRFSISRIKQINFKDKTEGWRKSSLYVIDECGNKYRQNRFNDIFYAFLLRRVPYQEACYSCAFRRHVISSDIRLGDFWGPKYNAWDDGVELMTLMSDKGRYAWNEIKDYFSYQICKEKDIYESQDSGAMNIHIKKPKNYEQILAALSSEQDIEEIFRDLQIAKMPIGN
jgi:coenzyme F420-reducing hydrogenase beta subunit